MIEVELLNFFIGFFSPSFEHLRHSVMNSFSPPIVISSGSTNVRCLVNDLFSCEHIPQTAVNILIDSTLDRKLRIF